MPQITIELTDKQRAFVEDQVAEGASPSLTAYVADLIRRRQFRTEEYSEEDISDEEFAAQMRERWAKAKARDPVAFQRAVDHMNELIREGIDSGPAVEMTPEEWDKLWDEVDDALAKHKKR